MLERIVSGGQTGADFGALRAARSAGLATGGWACRDWLIESDDGEGVARAPWLAEWGLRECKSTGFAARRAWNVRDSEATLLYYVGMTAGTRGLFNDLKRIPRPLGVVFLEAGRHTIPEQLESYFFEPEAIEDAAHFVAFPRLDIGTLNVAGPRASGYDGIERIVHDHLSAVLAVLHRWGALGASLAGKAPDPVG